MKNPAKKGLTPEKWAQLVEAVPAEVRALVHLLACRLEPTTKFSGNLPPSKFEFNGYTVCLAISVTGPGGKPWSTRPPTDPFEDPDVANFVELVQQMRSAQLAGAANHPTIEAQYLEEDLDSKLFKLGRPPALPVAMDSEEVKAIAAAEEEDLAAIS